MAARAAGVRAAASAPALPPCVSASPDGGGALIAVAVNPGAKHEEVVIDGDVLRIRTTAPPRDGEANAAVAEAVAAALRAPPSSVAVVRGHKARDKVVKVAGRTAEEVGAVLAALPRA
jgi:uncharacterized protein (TIGR00251 family)